MLFQELLMETKNYKVRLLIFGSIKNGLHFMFLFILPISFYFFYIYILNWVCRFIKQKEKAVRCFKIIKAKSLQEKKSIIKKKKKWNDIRFQEVYIIVNNMFHIFAFRLYTFYHYRCKRINIKSMPGCFFGLVKNVLDISSEKTTDSVNIFFILYYILYYIFTY